MTYFLGIIVFALIITALMQLRSFLVPITFSVLLTFIFHPLYLFLQKMRLPKVIALIVIVVFVFLVLYLFVLLINLSLSSFETKSPWYYSRLNELVAEILKPWNMSLDQMLSSMHLNISTGGSNEVAKTIFSSGIIQNIISSFSEILTDVFITVLFWFFMIAGKSAFDKKLITAFGSQSRIIVMAFKKIDKQVQTYLVVKTVMSLIMSVIVTVVLLFFGVDFAILWGIITFILHFIPTIGSMAATVLPVAFALMQYGFTLPFIVISSILVGNQFIFDNFIEPKYLGRQLNLSPVVVLLALFFWGWVWGIPGMFLSVPLTAIMKIVFDNIPSLKPIAVLMGEKIE